jgi:O-antigen ligase
MGSAAERAGISAGAVAICASAVFLSGGTRLGPLVAIGACALALTAVAVGLRAGELGPWAASYLGCLAALTVWSGLSVVWSSEPSNSWQFTNRLLVYLAFAALGVAYGRVAPDARRLADGASLLLALVLGWALLAKVVPALYTDYERVARLRGPIGYWNALAILAVVAVPLSLRLASDRDRRQWLRAAGVALLYLAVLCALLTYSRAGVFLAALAAAAWLVLEHRRVDSVVALALGAIPAAGVFLYALTLPGITDDGVSRAERGHDGWRFALVAVLAGVVVALTAFALARLSDRRRLSSELEARLERSILWLVAAVAVAAVVVFAVFARRIWRDFEEAVQVTQGPSHLRKLGSSNRWAWWQEAWHAFTRHPVGGTGAGTFDLTNQLSRTNPYNVALEPHNVPLQFLSETGIVGLLLFLGAAVSASVGIVRARLRTAEPAITALGIGLAAWLGHLVVDIDWSFLAVTGPLLFVAGALLGAETPVTEPAHARLLPALGAVAIALVGIYSLAAPWLADRELDRSSRAAAVDDSLRHAKRAHSLNPLSVDALLQWAAVEPRVSKQRELYREALGLEPLNPIAWYELGRWEYLRGNLGGAYLALDRSWGLDRLDGPLALRCSLLDRVRRVVKGYGPSCPPLPPGALP